MPHDPRPPGQRYERRQQAGRRETDDDKLTAEILLGYERWAGAVWRHRGKVLFACSLLAGATGCVVGYLGREHDLDNVRTAVSVNAKRITKLEEVQAAQLQSEPLNRQMLCSLMRRIDPNGVPPECNAPPTPRPSSP